MGVKLDDPNSNIGYITVLGCKISRLVYRVLWVSVIPPKCLPIFVFLKRFDF